MAMQAAEYYLYTLLKHTMIQWNPHSTADDTETFKFGLKAA